MSELEHFRDFPFRPVKLAGCDYHPLGLALGNGASSLEVVVTTADAEPRITDVRAAWKKRNAGRAAPLMLVVLHDGKATLCGPAGEDPPVYQNVDIGQAERICREALEQPDRHAALRCLRDALPSVESELPGIRNEGFLATHELARGVRAERWTQAWAEAERKSRPLLTERGDGLLRKLGFQIEKVDQAAHGRVSTVPDLSAGAVRAVWGRTGARGRGAPGRGRDTADDVSEARCLGGAAHPAAVRRHAHCHGVGLGKTFIAGEIIRLYQLRRQPVLLVCPASLRDSTWEQFLREYDFRRSVESISFEELAREVQLGGDQTEVQRAIDESALVVIDEARNYRNPDAPARAQVLRRLLMGPRRDLVLMTATPVNHSLWDLYHLLRYFVRQDAALADRGVLSIRERFEAAMREDPFNLNPDLLYPIIDATTVKRTRQFIIKYYENDLIRLPDGACVPIRLPKPVASSINYDLDKCCPVFWTNWKPHSCRRMNTRPAIDDGPLPAGELPGWPAGGTDTALVGLIRSGLLKRFESSVHASAKTTAKMVCEHDVFLRGLDQGVIVRRELLRGISASDEDVDIDELLATSEHREPADDCDVPALRAAVEADRKLLDRMCQKARR